MASEGKPESKKERKFDTTEFEKALALAREESSDGNLARLLKAAFGYDSFRDGHVEAVRNVVAGESMMVVLPTRAGKSLCYQLPTVILPGVTLVVNPLIMLMVDQIKQLPHMIHGGLICSNQEAETCKMYAEQKEEEVKNLERSVEELECTINVLEKKVYEMEDEVERHRLIRDALELELQALRKRLSTVENFTENAVSESIKAEEDEDLVSRQYKGKLLELHEAQKRIKVLEECS